MPRQAVMFALFCVGFTCLSSAIAQQPGEVVGAYSISDSWGYIHGLGWDGEQLWMTRYVYESEGPVYGDERVVYRVDIASTASGSTLASTRVLDLGWPSMEGCYHAGNHRLFVGPREKGSRASARIIEVDDRTGARRWEYAETPYTWPDGTKRGSYKDPDGVAFDGTHVYYLVKGDHDNLGKAAVTMIRYRDKSVVKRFWVPDESPVDIAFAGGWLIYKPRWRADRNDYPASNYIVFVDVTTTPDGGNAAIPHTYKITNIPSSDSGMKGGTKKFIHWGVAHDGGQYLYVNRNNGWREKGGRIYRVYCPLPGKGLSSRRRTAPSDPNRNELPADTGPAEDAKEDGFVSLFDGNTFAQWLNPTSRWSIQDGRMIFAGEVKSGKLKRENHKLMSVKEYADFILRFEFKLGERANSGVAVRAPLEGDAAFVAMEIQIIDHHNWAGLRTWQKHGSIYGVVPAKTGHLKPPGEWNSEEIICQGSHVKVTLNGGVIVDVDLQDLGGRPLDGKKHPGLKRTKGHIGFLPHTKNSEYRNIRIKELCRADRNTGLAFPTRKPEHVGMDETKLEEAKCYALTGGGSGCIVRGGRLVMAWGDQKQKYDIYSSTKSIGVTALGLAIMDGRVGLHDKAKQYLRTVGIPPEDNAPTGWLEDLTLWHLATQTGGFEKTRGWCRLANPPGTTWMYSDGGPNWLADCLTVTYGRDLQDVMNERVFEPLNISVGNTPRGGEHDLHWGFNNLDRP